MNASEDVWRRETPHVLGALLRRYGDFAACEDAVQEALLDASTIWPVEGIPSSARGWLIRVASRRLIEARRRDTARTVRELRDAIARRVDQPAFPQPHFEAVDATLDVLSLCCHPALSRDAQVTLALRAVLGLSTQQIAGVYLVPSATIGQRISRAKATIDTHARRFPPAETFAERLPAMLHTLYLTYTAGHSLPAGEHLLDSVVTSEAIRLARLLHARVPAEPEAAGLLALLLLTDARRGARTTAAGELVQLEHQNRGQWDRAAIAEGVELLEHTLPVGSVGAYQLQAAIAAVHAEAPSWRDTDWPQIVALYSMLLEVAPSPVVTLNYAVAVGETTGARAALTLLEPLTRDARLARRHRLWAVRAALLEADGRAAPALAAYREASRLCESVPEQRFLNAQIARLEVTPQ